MPNVRTALAVAGATAAAGLAWGFAEAHAYTTRRVTVPLLPAGSAPVRILHLSDLHLTPTQERRIEWVRSLARENVDLVVTTGDNLAHADAVPAVARALTPLFELPGAFVYGSNDYYAPTPINPFKYFKAPSGLESTRPLLPTQSLTTVLEGVGWTNLNNARGTVSVAGQEISFVGMDDPHIQRDSMPSDDGVRGDLHVGVVHAPYRRALDALHEDGVVLTLAGHTHGGQVCVPGMGALVTNCDIDRTRAKGLHGYPGLRPDQGDPASMWLHVSAGVGTSPYARVRFACRPEATVVTLVPRD
ncbi:metallophosphoesterase [Demequina oxidasica]|uniref:metallophosphoesterase n=1 Tax=Demequina oxidasica TaxID=676199 RepID=UPI00078154F7|nr:metallophosphoesterase [Demequina oxidasica]